MKDLKFYILCGNTAYNRGDRGNLKSQIKMLRDAFPGVRITLDSFNPVQDQKWFDALILERKIFPSRAQRQAMREADLILWGGGALLADNACRTLVPYWFLMIFYTKKILGKKIYAWAHGVVLETKLGRFFAKKTLSYIDKMTVRDENSLNAIRHLDLKNFPVRQTADAGITLSTSDKTKGEAILKEAGVDCSKKIVGFSPTFWHLYYQAPDIIPYIFGRQFHLYKNRNRDLFESYRLGISNLCEALLKQTDYELVLIPRYTCAPWRDVEILQSIAQKFQHKRVHVLVREDFPMEDSFAIYKRLDLLISVALHDAMFALSQGVPVCGLSYEPKCDDFFRAVGLTSYLRNWRTLFQPDGGKEIADLSLDLLKNWPALKPTVLQNVQKLQQAASSNLEEVKELLNFDNSEEAMKSYAS